MPPQPSTETALSQHYLAEQIGQLTAALTDRAVHPDQRAVEALTILDKLAAEGYSVVADALFRGFFTLQEGPRT